MACVLLDRYRKLLGLAWCVIPLLEVGCSAHLAKGETWRSRTDTARLSTARLSDDSNGRDWPGYGRTFGEQHYSPLKEVNAQTVGGLRLSWFMDLGVGNPATVPVAVDGVLYFAQGFSVVRAVDGATGKLLWSYDPKVSEVAGLAMRNGYGSRGIAYWNGKVYTGTVDGRLIAIDAHNGRLVWSTLTVDRRDGLFITGAPRAFDGKIIIGNGGADTTSTRGHVTTYDAESGKQLWRFFIVPGNPAAGFEDNAQKMAAETWSGPWWKYGGGGHAWNAFTYDKETNTVFIGTGDGAPWNHRIRSAGKGDNLFVCSIVALDARTGRYKWHYQINPGDSWDYDAVMDMQIADLRVGGKLRKVIMQAPKNGFLYVIDRETGKLISADKIAKITWATSIDLASGRPVEVPGARFPNGQDFELWPSPSGAHSWAPSAYNPRSGLLYIPLMESGVVINDRGVSAASWHRIPGNALDIAMNVAGADGPLNGTGWLLAVDPAVQKTVWKLRNPSMSNGGVLATGGDVVFQGLATGTFNAYAADSGRQLWSFATQAPVLSAPITYLVHGEQYVTVIVGAGTSAGTYPLAQGDASNQIKRVLTFALGGKASLPSHALAPFKASADPDYQVNVASARAGADIYFHRCLSCHGGEVVSGGTAPDLRTSSVPPSAEAFDSVVRGGI